MGVDLDTKIVLEFSLSRQLQSLRGLKSSDHGLNLGSIRANEHSVINPREAEHVLVNEETGIMGRLGETLVEQAGREPVYHSCMSFGHVIDSCEMTHETDIEAGRSCCW